MSPSLRELQTTKTRIHKCSALWKCGQLLLWVESGLPQDQWADAIADAPSHGELR